MSYTEVSKAHLGSSRHISEIPGVWKALMPVVGFDVTVLLHSRTPGKRRPSATFTVLPSEDFKMCPLKGVPSNRCEYCYNPSVLFASHQWQRHPFPSFPRSFLYQTQATQSSPTPGEHNNSAARYLAAGREGLCTAQLRGQKAVLPMVLF